MDNRPLVCDIGTGTTKVGFAGEDAPTSVFPTIIDIPHHICAVDEAQSKRRAISLKYPIEHGIVRNWDGMERIWNRIFDDELRVDPKEHPVLWTEPPLNPKADRQTMAQLMFETFNVPSIFIVPQTFLSMQAGGHITGIMLHCGDGVSYAVPGLGNCCRPHAAIRLDVAGGDITDYLMTSLREGGCYHMLERETVREMKEKLGYVAYDYEQELERSSSIKKDYLLPDGRVLTIGADRFRGPEVLFRPSLIGREGPGIHEMAYNSIRKYYDEAYSVDDSCRKVFNNILLTGGSTMFPGFVERMEKEITALDRLEKSPLADLRKRIIAPPERRWSAWIGGSIMAIQVEFRKRCISKTEYEERGPSILYERFSNFWDVPTWC